MEMAHFFDQLSSPGKGFAGSVEQFMSDHPNLGNRERGSNGKPVSCRRTNTATKPAISSG